MIKELVKRKRLNLGLTQQQLADKVNVRKATICTFETGKSQMKTTTLEKIFNILNITINENSREI